MTMKQTYKEKKANYESKTFHTSVEDALADGWDRAWVGSPLKNGAVHIYGQKDRSKRFYRAYHLNRKKRTA